MRWVLTRTEEDSRPLADALGCDVVPCIERHELPWPTWPSEPLVFVTSPAVARRLVTEWVQRPYIAMNALIAALAPASDQILRHGGIEPHVTARGGAVELALAVKQSVPFSATVLYPTSDVGMAQPEQEQAVRILESLGTVQRHVLYETRAPVGLARALARHRGDGFVFYSPSAVENFAAAGGEAGAALCVGASTDRAFRARIGWPEPLAATPETVKKALQEAMKT